MDRIILLALLGIPILIVIHVALFAQGLSSGIATAWNPDGVASLHGYWSVPDAQPRFVIDHISEKGS